MVTRYQNPAPEKLIGVGLCWPERVWAPTQQSGQLKPVGTTKTGPRRLLAGTSPGQLGHLRTTKPCWDNISKYNTVFYAGEHVLTWDPHINGQKRSKIAYFGECSICIQYLVVSVVNARYVRQK